MLASFEIAEHWVEGIVSLLISIGIGLWILSMFLPVGAFFSWVGGAFWKDKSCYSLHKM